MPPHRRERGAQKTPPDNLRKQGRSKIDEPIPITAEHALTNAHLCTQVRVQMWTRRCVLTGVLNQPNKSALSQRQPLGHRKGAEMTVNPQLCPQRKPDRGQRVDEPRGRATRVFLHALTASANRAFHLLTGLLKKQLLFSKELECTPCRPPVGEPGERGTRAHSAPAGLLGRTVSRAASAGQGQERRGGWCTPQVFCGQQSWGREQGERRARPGEPALR